MSSPNHSGHWIDRWWPLFLILFGVTCVSILVTFKPLM